MNFETFFYAYTFVGIYILGALSVIMFLMIKDFIVDLMKDVLMESLRKGK